MQAHEKFLFTSLVEPQLLSKLVIFYVWPRKNLLKSHLGIFL